MIQDGEFLTAVSGMYGIVINSLQFHTTTGRTSELFGSVGLVYTVT